VYKITHSGTLSIFAGIGTQTTPTPGPATSSSVGDPEGLAFDAAGNLYIADDHNDYVYKVTPGGTLSIFAGNGTNAAPTPGPATSSSISGVDGLAFDHAGNLYIVSYANNQVYKVTPGGTLSVFAGELGVNAAPTPGPATSSSIGFPEGIAVDKSGNVYVTDDEKEYVNKITPGGTLSVFAGNGSAAKATPGPAAGHPIGVPEYIALDRLGNAYITDIGHDYVYKVAPNGQLSIYAGNGTNAKGTAGPASASAIGAPEAIAVDPQNNVYVSDTHNLYIYKITNPSGYDLVGRDGGVFVFPTGMASGFFGSLPGLHVTVHNIVGIVPSSDYQGYTLVGSDGGVFSFGDTTFVGSLPGIHVSVNNVVGLVPTRSNHGYFLVGSDGGVFAFGDAHFLGSLPGSHISVNNIVGIAATPDDQGYWLVSADGHVYHFGDAANLPNVGAGASPIAGISGAPNGQGAWIVRQNGQVIPEGSALSYGDLPGLHVTPALPIESLVPTAGGNGYWLIGSDGGTFGFGDSTFVGSLPGLGVHVTDIVGAVPTLGG
jgi:sugar lactone lactonase YvrE